MEESAKASQESKLTINKQTNINTIFFIEFIWWSACLSAVFRLFHIFFFIYNNNKHTTATATALSVWVSPFDCTSFLKILFLFVCIWRHLHELIKKDSKNRCISFIWSRFSCSLQIKHEISKQIGYKKSKKLL